MNIKQYNKLIKETSKQLNSFDLSKLDEDFAYLKKSFDLVYDNNLLALYNFDIKTQEILKQKLFSKLTKYSGSLSFLAIQILAANSIMNKNDFKNKEYYFQKKCGIAINHLRSNKTVVYATKCEDGYKLYGTITWASGYKIFDKILIGFHYDNKEYEVLADFEEDLGFSIIDTAETFVGQSLNTINVQLNNFFVNENDIVSLNSIGNYTKNKSLSKTVHYAIYGIGLSVIKEISDKDFKKNSKKRLKKIKTKIIESKDPLELEQLRIRLFNLVQKIVTMEMILDGGKSILKTKNMQRFYRELILFNSNGLNQNIKELFLDDFILEETKTYA